MVTWPNWHDIEFPTEMELFGLEDYLNARSGLIEGDRCDGVEQFDPDSSLSAEIVESKVLRVTVRGLLGVASGGSAVIVRQGEPPLQCDFSLEVEEARSVSSLDLTIEVNPRRPGFTDRPYPKFILRVVHGDIPLDLHNTGLSFSPGRLFLGRYTWSGERPEVLTLEARPRVRRLAALWSARRGGSGWDEWVAPLRERIEEALRKVELRPAALTVAGWTSAVELARLEDEWPYLPITTLARQLLRVRRLQARDLGRRLESVYDVDGLLPPTGDGLPSALARLLDPPDERDDFVILNRHVTIIDGVDGQIFDEGDLQRIIFRRDFAPSDFLFRIPRETEGVEPRLQFHKPGYLGIIECRNPVEAGDPYFEYPVLIDPGHVPVDPPASGETWHFSPASHVAQPRLWFREGRSDGLDEPNR